MTGKQFKPSDRQHILEVTSSTEFQGVAPLAGTMSLVYSWSDLQLGHCYFARLPLAHILDEAD